MVGVPAVGYASSLLGGLPAQVSSLAQRRPAYRDVSHYTALYRSLFEPVRKVINTPDTKELDPAAATDLTPRPEAAA